MNMTDRLCGQRKRSPFNCESPNEQCLGLSATVHYRWCESVVKYASKRKQLDTFWQLRVFTMRTAWSWCHLLKEKAHATL
jgi:hypothetical protein